MSMREESVVQSDSGVMSGTPVFVGTRVPFQTMIDYLEGGQPRSDFLQDFPAVSREHAVATLEQAKDALIARARPDWRSELMNVELTADQRAFVQRAIESGRFSRQEDAVQEALALWEERERRRLEILAMVDEAEASLARGEGREITEESMKALAEDVKQRMRRRIAVERSATSGWWGIASQFEPILVNGASSRLNCWKS
jgi:putative addiction module CopG family antidote